jgi:hypothetical protein
MKKYDLILLGIIIVVSIISYGVLKVVLNQSSTNDGTATVMYLDNPILEIFLEDGSYNIIDDKYVNSIDEDRFIYTVTGTNGDVVIQYKDFRVRVIDEISPQNICQAQGWSSSPLRPITCLPNNLVIIIEADQGDDEPDDISS